MIFKEHFQTHFSKMCSFTEKKSSEKIRNYQNDLILALRCGCGAVVFIFFILLKTSTVHNDEMRDKG